MMQQILRSPWLTVVLAIAVLSIGYVSYLQEHGTLAMAKSYFCPMKEICTSGACGEENACNSEDCKSCPHCKKGATS